MQPTVYEITSDYADVWIASDNQPGVDYGYGGTRMVEAHMPDADVHGVLDRLMHSESALKNQLINKALRQQALSDRLASRTPDGFIESSVGGARCIIRPKSQELAAILNAPAHPRFTQIIATIFAQIGDLLNQQQGRIKLTPDFGRFAGLADILAEFTPHVLGIRCEDGGCGGKSSYSATGIIAALETIGVTPETHPRITLIGSAGAMGSHILEYCQIEGFADIGACDHVYHASTTDLPARLAQLPAQDGMFTDACLSRGGVIVATTVGHELEHSQWQRIPRDTIMLLAHNLAVPAGEPGIDLMRRLAEQGVLVVPGQVLTLGGALTSRVEWFWRQSRPGEPFDKPLAHLVVRAVVSYLIGEMLSQAHITGLTPYETMLRFAQDQPTQVQV
ncbi:MAG TPA: hypothetical protein VFZ66_17970 [Herpetosiphonaceae bacterium]